MDYKKTDQILMAKGSIKKERLSKTQFMISLLREGFSEGLVDKPVIDRIGYDMMFLLNDLINRYTKGESTSLKVDTAEMLMNSICYSIDAGFSDCSSPEKCIALLKVKPLKEIYYDGIKNITACVEKIRNLIAEMQKIRMDIPLEAYIATIESIPAFFNVLSIMFAPQDSVPSIDYPLVFDDWSVRGVYYMKNYIETLNLETKVCRLFNIEDIKQVLESYGRIYNIDYRKCLINIFELTINNAVFSVLSGYPARQLLLSNEQYTKLNIELSKFSSTQLQSNIDKAFQTVILELGIRASEQIEYLMNYKGVFLTVVKSSIKIQGLEKLIIIRGEEAEEHTNSAVLQQGERLDERSFLSLLKDLSKCSSIPEKADKIMSRVHSWEDFIDILETDCFYGDEFLELFSKLGDFELSVLVKTLFYEDLREGNCDLSLIETNDTQTDREWQQQFVKFLTSLDSFRKESVERYINPIGSDNEIEYY